MEDKTTSRFASGEEKEAFVQEVFSKIAGHYDVMNTLLSFGQDRYWRRFAIERMDLRAGARVLDVACGTGMLTLEALDQVATLQVAALDFNGDMLTIAKDKVRQRGKTGQVEFVQGDAMALPFADHSFDAAMSAFAMRNVPDVKQMLMEMKRVVRPGGKVVTLELAKPGMLGFRQAYYLYFEKLLPWLGKLGVHNSAYAWLPESLRRYPHQREILALFDRAGYQNTACYELTGGIVAVHTGEVPKSNS